ARPPRGGEIRAYRRSTWAGSVGGKSLSATRGVPTYARAAGQAPHFGEAASRKRPTGCETLLPLVPADQLDAAERVSGDGLLERGLGRPGRDADDGVERVQLEEVPVGTTAGRRTRPAVPDPLEVVRPLARAVLERRRLRDVLGERVHRRRDVPHPPVHPGARRRVGIVAHE